MRISNLSIKRNYTNQLQRSQKRMVDSGLNVPEGRRFNSMSEDVALGLRALKVRRALDKNAAWQDNVGECKSVIKASEDALYNGILPIADAAQFDKYTQALNGTCGPDEYAAIGAELIRLQEELLTNLNAQFSGRYLFGGSQTDEAPFSVDPASKKLMYKGELVEDITTIVNDPVYIDIGLGAKLDAAGNPIPSTVFNRSINGLDVVGIGADNMYDVLGRMITSLDTGNLDDQLLKKMETAGLNAKTMVTKIGADDNYLNFANERLSLDKLNLIERQDALEFLPEGEAILEFEMMKYAYNASLQMGTNILQPGLFSFLK